MEYVMVPVPEEIVDEVRSFLQWHVGQASQPEPDNPDAIVELYAAGDAATRGFLGTVAATTVEGERPRFNELADQLGLSARELMGLANEINARFRTLGGGMAAFLLRPDPKVEQTADDLWGHHLVFMANDLARRLVDD